MIWETVVQPFADFGFMRRALLGCIAISLGATPIGVFLMLRRISLTGCAMASAVLPGAATGYLIFGLSLVPMTFGGLGAGLAVALLSGFVTRRTQLLEDSSLAAFSDCSRTRSTNCFDAWQQHRPDASSIWYGASAR